MLTGLTSDAVARTSEAFGSRFNDVFGDHLPDWVLDDPFGDFDPTRPPDFPGGGGGGFEHTAVRIELYAPRGTEPIQVWELPNAIAGTYREVKYYVPGFPSENSPSRTTGWFRVVVIPTNGVPAWIRVEASAILSRVPFRTRVIRRRLADHLFRVVLEALVPKAMVMGDRLTVTIGNELAHEFGISPVLTEETLPYGLQSQAELKSLTIRTESGRDLKRFAQTKSRTPPWLPRVQDNDVVVRIEAAFYRGSATAYGFDVGKLNGDLGVVFLSFGRHLTELSPVSFLDVAFSRAAQVVIPIVGLFTEANLDIVNQKIESTIDRHRQIFLTYFREVLSRAMGQHAVVHEVSWGGGGWQIRYFDDPPMPNPDAPYFHWVDDVFSGFGGVDGLMEPTVLAFAPSLAGETGTVSPGEMDAGRAPPPAVAAAAATASTLGVFPEGFLNVDDPVALSRLDHHKSIVVIMMENRSFDHLLGGLAAARPRANPQDRYDCAPSDAANARCGGFADNVPLVRAERIALGTQILVDPRHFTGPTAFQMGDGSTRQEGQATGDMQGFARDLFNNRTDSPQLAMTMYGEQHLPTYYRLADQFCVADRWFCAHPGPTWPNRYATVLGKIPLIDNHAIDDPEIGFIRHYSIFDALTSNGVEWKVFESDLSLVRTLDRFRLDDRRVVPIHDKDDGLEATLRAPGPLPRVMFIEPNFADLPPLATANDDHPPTDLAIGQKFIAEMCDLIWRYRFEECLIVITYDEHGGFYDHVAPPGTPKGDPVFFGQVPKLHPEGPDYLGPRVPTFILSPLVSAGSVTHTVFDHTSILKTILVHNRQKIPTSTMASFGERVSWTTHLGQALDLSTPRQRPQFFEPMRWRRPGLPDHHLEVAGTSAVIDAGGARDVVAGGALDLAVADAAASGPPPPTPRTVSIVPVSAGVPLPEGEPDFHRALRGALKPRTR